MPHDDSTRAWLDTRSDDQLRALLEIRPDLRLGAPLVDLDDLASRIEHPMSISAVATNLPLPAIEVAELVMALGAGATRGRIIALLDSGGRDPESHERLVLHWLHVLDAVGLAWEVPGLEVAADGLPGEATPRYAPNPGLHQLMINPLMLGRPVHQLVADLTADGLRRLYSGLGVRAPKFKAELLAGLPVQYADPAPLRRILATAPAEVAEALTAHATEGALASMSGELMEDEDDRYPRGPGQWEAHRRQQAMLQWAQNHGLAVRDPYAYNAVHFPSEVMVALAPPTFRARFHPEAPAVPTTQVSQVQTERDSAAAVTATVAAITAVLESTQRAPVQELKAGGVGARELKRVAKSVGVDEAEVRLALELGASCHFFPPAEPLSAAGQFATWRQLTPPERAADLLLAWWPLNYPPTLDRDADGKALPALADYQPAGAALVGQLLDILTSLGDEATMLEPVLERLAWARPLDHPPEALLRATWDEATRLGVVRDGRITRLGQALASGDRGALVEVLGALLPQESSEVLFGSDLTVVAPGSLPAAVVDLLDAVAVRASHGVGATWRISETSVREAFDNGYQVEDLVAALREVAGRALPQPLEYLLRDVARRHGLLGVRPAACVVVAEDAALLEEVAATRALRSLGLAVVAPTVLVGTADVATTLAALRKAGYFPVEQEVSGARTVQLRSLAVGAESGTGGGDGPANQGAANQGAANQGAADEDGADESGAFANLTSEDLLDLIPRRLRRAAAPEEGPEELLARLRSGGPPPADPVDPAVQALVRAQARALRPDEHRHLAAAVTEGRAVVIRYRNEAGNESERVVSEMSVSGDYLTAFCHLRQDVRYFRLDRITLVAPTL